MTIAACYLSTEGVVLGADSTSTMFVAGPGSQPGSEHHYNYAQKVFELGDNSTAGVAIWGLGSIGELSYRTLIADVADTAITDRLINLEAVAVLLANSFWSNYERVYANLLDRARDLASKNDRSPDESDELVWLGQGLSGGFCVGGRWGATRHPHAYEILFEPSMNAAPVPKGIPLSNTRFWGCPNLISRILYGIDERLFSAILSSGKWSGMPDDLFKLVSDAMLAQPADLPLREAVDWVYASIYTTIKGMKFSHLAPVCGRPIEIGVITSDRLFRWVRHKQLDEAIE